MLGWPDKKTVTTFDSYEKLLRLEDCENQIIHQPFDVAHCCSSGDNWKNHIKSLTVHTLRKNVVSSVTTCSNTDDKSIFKGDSEIVAKACKD